MYTAAACNDLKKLTYHKHLHPFLPSLAFFTSFHSSLLPSLPVPSQASPLLHITHHLPNPVWSFPSVTHCPSVCPFFHGSVRFYFRPSLTCASRPSPLYPSVSLPCPSSIAASSFRMRLSNAVPPTLLRKSLQSLPFPLFIYLSIPLLAPFPKSDPP